MFVLADEIGIRDEGWSQNPQTITRVDDLLDVYLNVVVWWSGNVKWLNSWTSFACLLMLKWDTELTLVAFVQWMFLLNYGCCFGLKV